MADECPPRVRVECTDCSYSAVVSASDDELAATLVVRHGRETGHTLSVTALEPGESGET